MLRRTCLAVLAVLTLAVSMGLAARPAYAWDPEADRAAAQLAYERLTPVARAAVDAAFAGGVVAAGCPVRGLDDDAALAACLHDRKGDFMRDLPYDLIPLCGGPAPARWCKDGRCASAALKHDIAALTAPAASRADRALAIEAVAYLLTELHQPLHAADNGDRSGDRLRVTLPGALKARTSLYSVWDNDLVASAIGTAESGLPYLRALADAQGEAWAKGDVDDWVAETHDVALHTAYGRLPNPPACNKLPDRPEMLGADYFTVAVPAVRTQLARAGVRLAAVLNAAFASPATSAPDDAAPTGARGAGDTP